MQVNIIFALAALIVAFGLGYLICRSRWLPAVAAARDHADRLRLSRDAAKTSAANLAVERDHFSSQFKKAITDLESVTRQRDEIALAVGNAEQAAAIERERANSLQQELTAERAKPKVTTVAETLNRGAKPQRDTLRPRFEKKPANAPLVERVKAAVAGKQEIAADTLANGLATAELGGNRLREEIKPIMRQLGFEEKRTARRKGKGQHRVWRKK